jgi:hypothetical protein
MPGEQLCEKCAKERGAKRRVYLHFMWRAGWYCQFLEDDLKTPIPRKVVLPDSAKLLELVERGGYVLNLENRQALEHAITNGRGSVWLELTADQYAKLWESSDRKRR